jgi:agmatinase
MDRDIVGFTLIEVQEIDKIGMESIIHKATSTVGDTLVYIPIDIDGD